jgi:hypothetical protein
LDTPWTLGYRSGCTLDTLPEQILDEITDKYPAQLGYNEISGAGGRGPSCHCASPRAVLPLNLVAMCYIVVGGSRWQSGLTVGPAARRGADRHRQPAALRGGPSRGMGARQPRLASGTCHSQPFLSRSTARSARSCSTASYTRCLIAMHLDQGRANMVAIGSKVIWAPPCIFP